MSAARKLLDALELWEDGVRLMRENLRRRHPDATDEQLEDELARWLAGPEIDEPDRVVRPGPIERVR